MTFWPWLRNSTKKHLDLMSFLALPAEVDKINPRSLDVMSSCPRLQESAKSIPRGFDLMMLYAAEVDQNQMQKSRFDDLLALAPEVDKVSPSDLDLKTSRPWFQKSTKSVPEVSIS
jgi:hypothetical protein